MKCNEQRNDPGKTIFLLKKRPLSLLLLETKYLYQSHSITFIFHLTLDTSLVTMLKFSFIGY